jgi:hypothetical protein
MIIYITLVCEEPGPLDCYAVSNGNYFITAYFVLFHRSSAMCGRFVLDGPSSIPAEALHVLLARTRTQVSV